MGMCEEIAELQERAAAAAQEVARQLEAGAAPDALVPQLRKQLELVDALHQKISDLAAGGDSPGEHNGRTIEDLKAGAETLAKLSEANHRQATRKGIRLTPARRVHSPRPKDVGNEET